MQTKCDKKREDLQIEDDGVQEDLQIKCDDEQEVSDFDEDDYDSSCNKSDEQVALECEELQKLFLGFKQFERDDRSLREYRNCFNMIHGEPLEHLIKTKKLGVWCYYYGLSYDDAILLFGHMEGFKSSMVMENM